MFALTQPPGQGTGRGLSDSADKAFYFFHFFTVKCVEVTLVSKNDMGSRCAILSFPEYVVLNICYRNNVSLSKTHYHNTIHLKRQALEMTELQKN